MTTKIDLIGRQEYETLQAQLYSHNLTENRQGKIIIHERNLKHNYIALSVVGYGHGKLTLFRGPLAKTNVPKNPGSRDAIFER